jgi:hypothetical protein
LSRNYLEDLQTRSTAALRFILASKNKGYGFEVRLHRHQFPHLIFYNAFSLLYLYVLFYPNFVLRLIARLAASGKRRETGSFHLAKKRAPKDSKLSLPHNLEGYIMYIMSMWMETL